MYIRKDNVNVIRNPCKMPMIIGRDFPIKLLYLDMYKWLGCLVAHHSSILHLFTPIYKLSLQALFKSYNMLIINATSVYLSMTGAKHACEKMVTNMTEGYHLKVT